MGGQDELIFDGASFVVNATGDIVFRAEEFKEQISIVEFNGNKPIKSACAPLYNEISSEYQALVLGIKDYVRKNGFKGAILGLSGGIDSINVMQSELYKAYSPVIFDSVSILDFFIIRSVTIRIPLGCGS